MGHLPPWIAMRQLHPPISIRPAAFDDLSELVPLFEDYRRFYGQPGHGALARRFLAERLVRGESHLLLAVEEKGSLVGFAQLYPMFSSIQCQRTLVLNDLFVAPEMRGQGIGIALLEQVRLLAKRQAARSVSLQTAQDNHQARHLYERFGFERDDCFLSYELVVS